MLTIGIHLFGNLQMPLNEFVMTLINIFLIIIAYCSIYNLITMLSSEITLSTTICVILFMVMFVIVSALSLTVNASPYTTQTFWDEQGQPHIIEQELNPNYPGEEKIKVAKVIYYFIPQGQANDIANGKTENLQSFPLYSITLIFVVNLVGIYLFDKKELK